MANAVFEATQLGDVYVDGFANFHLANGILRCSAYTEQGSPGERVTRIATFRLIMPFEGARASTQEAMRVLNRGGQLHLMK